MARKSTTLAELRAFELRFPSFVAPAGGRRHRKGGRRARALGSILHLGGGLHVPMRRRKGHRR